MKKDEHFSEEQLNALVDGELDPEERSVIYNRSERQPELDQRICKQRKIKELVKHAYEDVPQVDRPRPRPLSRRRLFSTGLAAGVLLAVGLVIGVIGHSVLDQQAQNRAGLTTVQTADGRENYLLHVVSGDPEQMYAALEQATFLLDAAGEGEVGHVEIVANERGIDLLRSDVTPFAREIAELQKQDVVFYACSRTIERLNEEGIEVVLVPEARQEYTAIDRVVSRMQQGWQYEKI
jgi:intracellular sulfur oxidation DsrE/DsrF family protein